MPNTSLIPIPFDIRATTAAAVFGALEIAQDLLKTGQIYPITLSAATIGQIALVQSQLFSTYTQLIHQDILNQQSVLNTLCTAAQTQISNLTTIVAGIPTTLQNAVTLIVLDGRLQSYTAQMAAVLTHF